MRLWLKQKRGTATSTPSAKIVQSAVLDAGISRRPRDNRISLAFEAAFDRF